MTRQVVEAAKPLKIVVHDHLVVGRDGVASLKGARSFLDQAGAALGLPQVPA